jgi:hypothetical protein
MKNLINILIIIILYSCESKKTGSYEFIIENNSNYNVGVEFNNSIPSCTDCYNDVVILPQEEFTLDIVEWDFTSQQFPELYRYDSINLTFNGIKQIKYENNEELINEKNIFNFNTYETIILNSSKKKIDDKRFIFEITEQDYLLADSL